MSKFLLNLLLQISKALVNSKNPIFIRKEFFLRIRPTRPSLARADPLRTAGRHARALGPSRPTRPWRNCQKLSLLRVCTAQRRHLPPLSPPTGPHLSDSPLPRAGRPCSEIPRASPQLIAPRLPTSIIATPIKAPYSPALIPPLESR
jgi:hypothetical protein